MMLYQYQKDAPVIGLIFRHRDWHVCEHNKIVASWDRIPVDLKERALRGLIQHKAAAASLGRILSFEEPRWGNEREETEKYSDLGPSINGGPISSILEIKEETHAL